MDLIKAQRLLNKIQAFLDNGNGHELSRLEKDLIKSYVQQLYDAVTMEDQTHDAGKAIETPLHKGHRIEPTLKVEPPVIHPVDPPKTEPFKQSHTEYTPPVIKHEPQVYPDISSSDTKEKNIEEEAPKEETKYTPVHEPKMFEFKPIEPVKENMTTSKPFVSTNNNDEALNKLFEVQKADEMGSRFSHVPIASIESAMGLNERIFTLNELFGGDKGLFDAWCTKLNSLNSFAEAKNVLMAGPAKDFKWADPERIKMAEQFIRIVSRRYPKSTS
jgi:hypothetical protein